MPKRKATPQPSRVPATLYRVQSNEAQTLFRPWNRSFRAPIFENPAILFASDTASHPSSFPRLVTYVHMHLNNELMNTPFISLDRCPFSALNRAREAERKQRTGVFVAEVNPALAKGRMNLWDARALARDLDARTAAEFNVVRAENWRFTRGEWLTMNEIPGEAVGRVWSVRELGSVLTQVEARLGKQGGKLPKIPAEVTPLLEAAPVDPLPPPSILPSPIPIEAATPPVIASDEQTILL